MREIRISIMTILMTFLSIKARCQTEFKTLNTKEVIPTLVKGCIYGKTNNRYWLIKCEGIDSLVIRPDTTIYYHNKERALMIFTTETGGGHFGGITSNYLELIKNQNGNWEEVSVKMNVTKLSHWEESPKFNVLALNDGDYGLLISVNNYGSHGYFYYECELHSLERGKIFSLNTLTDNTGAKEKKTETTELTKTIFTQNSLNQQLICVQTKGHIKNLKKVNYTQHYKYNEEHNYYLPFKKVQNK